jgi:hypothetical protein
MLHYPSHIFVPGRRLDQTRSEEFSPLHYDHHSSLYHHNSFTAMGSPYYRDMDEPISPAGGGHHRSRSASRPPISHTMDYGASRKILSFNVLFFLISFF